MSTPTVAGSVRELLDLLSGIARLDGDRLAMEDEGAFRGGGIRDLAWSATFSEDPVTVEAARWIIWEASQSLGSPSASIHELYMARGRGEVSGFTVPAVNLRAQVFDMAAAMCRAAQAIDSGTIVFELARSEQEYTFQRPGEYITSVLAGCISASWQGPVFVQG
ncbi:MAG: aldolase, partial [Chloroflexota bacterium]|nr:aldolase [Chloroflexota bacterium]